jgi:large subunit ribosomal protein L15
MVEKGLIKNTKSDVKVLGQGELSKKLSVTAHAFSAVAREKIVAAGGTVTALKEPAAPHRKRRRVKRAGAGPDVEPMAPEPEESEAGEADTSVSDETDET